MDFCSSRFFKGTLVPLGPNYEAVGGNPVASPQHAGTVRVRHSEAGRDAVYPGERRCERRCSFRCFLPGRQFRDGFCAVDCPRPSRSNLYAAVGMAALIAAGYKTPLAAVVFVAEATGGHAFISAGVDRRGGRVCDFRRSVSFGRSAAARRDSYSELSNLPGIGDHAAGVCFGARILYAA